MADEGSNPDLELSDSGAFPAESLLERKIGLARVLDAVGVVEDGPPRLGRFTVVRKLGSGAMGSVYEAQDPELERLVAIKVLGGTGRGTEPSRPPGPTSSGSESAESLIRNEARALARLSHPNVVSVYDVGETDGQVFVAMEHMPGGSVAQLLDENPPGHWSEMLGLFIDAGRGLAAAHAAGIVHRDFKADNVLLDAGGLAKVADFGLADHDALMTPPHSDSPRYVVGTRAYMAPEVFRGEPATPASDQYSFCATVLAAARVVDVRVPANVQAVLARGLHDDAAERWPSLAALLDALERRMDATRDRRRQTLLDRVQTIWIDGVLDASLAGRSLVDLDVARAPDLVDSPWEHAPASQRPDAGATTSELPDLFARSNGALLIVGAPGAGKTTAALALARSLLDAARQDPAAPLPVILNLASYTRDAPLQSWVVRELVSKYRLPRQRVQQWLDGDDLVLILDGLDELSSARRGPCIAAINAFRREHAVAMVVACREAEYRASETQLMLGDAVRIEPLRAEQASAWGVDAVEEDERLRTPLWLTLAAGGPTADAPSWDAIYARYIAGALDRPPALDSGARDQWWRRLRWLATNMARRGDSDLWLDTMQYTWLPGFPRQALGMALGLVMLAVLFVIPGMIVLPLVGSNLLAGFVLGLGGLVMGLAFNGGLKVRTGERVRWSLRMGLRRAPIMVGLCATVAVVHATVVGRPVGMTLFAGGLGGLVAGFLLGLEYVDRSRGIHPYDGLRGALRRSARVGLASALVLGLAYALVIAPATVHMYPEIRETYPGVNLRLLYSVPLGILLGTTMWAVYGGMAVVLHAAYRIVLALTTPLPLRLVTWLDEATRRGLMRRVGGGYMFMHATLLERLAAGLEDPGGEPPPPAPSAKPAA